MRIIAGSARGRTIDAPKGQDTRPTLDRVRENLFNILQGRLWDARVLDLFAGSGALALEALSRGAKHAVLCDRAREPHEVEKRNAARLGFEGRCECLLCDWRQALERVRGRGDRFDLIFLDPPYRFHDLTEVTQRCAGVMAPGGRIIIEHAFGEPLAVWEGLACVDTRKYGIAAISLYAGEEGTNA